MNELRKLDGVFDMRARVARHEVRHEVLLLAELSVHFLERLDEAQVHGFSGLSHESRDAPRYMLGRDAQLSADMMTAQHFQKIIVRLLQVVEANA